MTVLYILEQGAHVRKDGQALLVEKDGKRIGSRPMKELESLILFGGVQTSTQALLSLLERGCRITLMTRGGHFRGSVVPAIGKNVTLRREQYRRGEDPDYCLGFSRRIVRAKIRLGLKLLRDYHYNPNNPARMEGLDSLERLAEKLESAASLESLRGLEGAAAREYFERMAQCLTGPLGFPGRHYYPATDPVNALLSLGYAFVHRELAGLLQAHDFDPCLGFFHQVEYGRPSLALDLLEPFRPALADRLTLRLLNKKVLGEKDFVRRDDKAGCYLNPEAMRTYIRQYEEWVERPMPVGQERLTFRELFRRQVESLKRELSGKGEFEPVGGAKP